MTPTPHNEIERENTYPWYILSIKCGCGNTFFVKIVLGSPREVYLHAQEKLAYRASHCNCKKHE